MPRRRLTAIVLILAAIGIALFPAAQSLAQPGIGPADASLHHTIYYPNSNWSRSDSAAVQLIDWYQGQEGQWHKDPRGHWYWHPRGGDEWYWGQRGHWYKEPSGWQFGSNGLVCNNNGRDCRYGRYLPANGEGMVNRRNPNLYWHCDSSGHNCNWARRPL